MDIHDRRCKALDHLCKLIVRLPNPPRWIALENVKGFYSSEACAKWRAALLLKNYSVKEYLLDLASFGTPNHRTRYYLVAELSDRFAGRLPTPCALAEDFSDDESPEIPRRVFQTAVSGKPSGLLARGPWALRFRTKVAEANLGLSTCVLTEGNASAFGKLRASILAEFQHRALTHGQTLDQEGSQAFSAALQGLAKADDWLILPYLEDGLLIGFPSQGRVDQEVARSLLPELQRIFESEHVSNVSDSASWSWIRASTPPVEARPISEFLADLTAEEFNDLLLPEAVLDKPFARGLSYVKGSDCQSFCFTGHYGKVLHKSSGSLLHLAGPEEALDRNSLVSTAYGKVRFFSPKEILNLLGFPRNYVLPEGIERRHCYKAVGNSIAVHPGCSYSTPKKIQTTRRIVQQK